MPVPLESAQLPAPRLKPGDLADITVADRRNRAVHALGKAYRDVVRDSGRFCQRAGLRRLPEIRARCRVGPGMGRHPARRGDSVWRWNQCRRGVEPRGLEAYNGIVSPTSATWTGYWKSMASRAASVQAGAAGPVVEEQLKQRGLTTRFFPQSFEFSTVGGWIATRAGGHYASGPTHIDDMVESIRAITSRGLWESRRLPASGAGPSPDRLLLGSEGALAVITQAWLRVVPRPEYKQGASMRLPDFAAGCEALRGGSARRSFAGQLSPDRRRGGSKRRSSPAAGPRLRGFAGRGGGAVCSATDMPQARSRGHRRERRRFVAGAFLQAPYPRDILVSVGAMAETFETATTWDRLDGLISDVRDAAQSAVIEVCGRPGRVTCRLTHCSTDGATPTSPSWRPSREARRSDAWDAIKVRVSDALPPPAAPSHTITVSAATTCRGTTSNAQSRSPLPCAQRRTPSTRPVCSTRACWSA